MTGWSDVAEPHLLYLEENTDSLFEIPNLKEDRPTKGSLLLAKVLRPLSIK